MQRSAFRSRHRNAPRPPEKSCRGYLQWLRGRPCFLEWTGECEGGIEAAHVDHAGGKGMATKVRDTAAIPLCSGHAREQHGQTGAFRERGGWKTFEAKYDFDAPKTAARYFDAWPGRIAWLAKLEAAR